LTGRRLARLDRKVDAMATASLGPPAARAETPPAFLAIVRDEGRLVEWPAERPSRARSPGYSPG
ncbi:MAG TPA: hypothetical protein PLQ29_04610, partial [Spirochaetales bacterium]|nr:hypothetical protein [Spirochaetales bacterium]